MERLVVLRALGLGDLLTAVPALRALAAAFPRHRRLLAAPAVLRPLVDLLGGVVDEVVDTDYRQRFFSALAEPLRGADIAVNLHGRGPDSHAVLTAARPGKLLAFQHADAPASAGGPLWDANEHEVDRWCRLLDAYGIAADPTRLTLDVSFAEEPHRATMVHPGAAYPARRWPAERWAAVARAESAADRDVLITGGLDEVGIAHGVAVRAGLPPSNVWAGRTDLLDLAQLVSGAGRVLCGDTGMAHLATALRVPSIVLFGPTSPSHWGPRIDTSLHRVLWKGRTGDPHARTPDRGLLKITVDDVLHEVAKLPADVHR